ncbi:ATP-binding protein [Enterococcus sp. AZ149]|uniref:ATP-binding protein n=1 Tax=Enterococcus sp. AZ149 TaxID=2774686 RepID=UPI003F291294
MLESWVGTVNIKTVSIEKIRTMPESAFFDRKSGKIKPQKLAETLIAFANTNGGIVAVGINDGILEGVNQLESIKLNDLIQVGYDCCKPVLPIRHEFREITKSNGNKDRVLLIEVDPSYEKVYSTMKDKVFTRVGDETKELSYEQRKDLEYERGSRSFESETNPECLLEDLDESLLERFKQIHDYKKNDIWNLLFSRGLAKRLPNKEYVLTNAAIILFSNYPHVFLPNAKIRFIRYEGSEAQTGTRMNVIKNETVEGSLPNVLDKIISIVAGQLREFNFLNIDTKKFEKAPEYPEEAWIEGIVNAAIHRSYNISGDDIRVMMYDDRLEIQSPGKFPSIVTPKNIREVHFSKNPIIARTMNDLKWVREFGEGVDRIYSQMEAFFLDDPIYEEKNNTVKLTLKNNIYIRKLRQSENIEDKLSIDWSELTIGEQRALSIIYNKGKIKTAQLAKDMNNSTNTARKILESLEAKGTIEKIASSRTDPNQYYIFKNDMAANV